MLKNRRCEDAEGKKRAKVSPEATMAASGELWGSEIYQIPRI